MDQFLSIIIFSVPGLLTYFWLQMFGVNPTTKHTPTEMVGLSALLMIPTTFLTIVTYDLFYLILDLLLRSINWNLSFLNMSYLLDLKDLSGLSSNLLFLLYYTMLSVIYSFVVAGIWAVFLYKKSMDLINKVRIKRGISKLSEETTVWDNFFLRLEKPEESALIVQIFKIDKPEEKICGPVIRMSRPFEAERSVIIDDPVAWAISHKHYKYPIKKTYVDTKSGMIINELDHLNPNIRD